MPDISMCSGKDCPLKESCYRFKAVPSEYRQSWLVTPPYNPETKTCDHYWEEDDPKPRRLAWISKGRPFFTTTDLHPFDIDDCYRGLQWERATWLDEPESI